MKLGDVVAEGIDYLTGGLMQPCAGCEERRQQLNDFGDRLLNKIDVLRGRGKLETMTYLVTVNTQKRYKVEADSSDEALSKISPQNETFTATTSNVSIQQPGAQATVPPGTAVPA